MTIGLAMLFCLALDRQLNPSASRLLAEVTKLPLQVWTKWGMSGSMEQVGRCLGRT